jgi:hypothetical protein
MKTSIFFLTLLLSLSISEASSKTWVVTSNTDGGKNSLREMLFLAGDGDNIIFALPVGYEVISLYSELFIQGKSLTIDGRNTEPGSGFPVTVQVLNPGQSPYRLFRLDPGFRRSVTLKNLMLRGGDVSGSGTMADGGVILLELDGALTLSRCVVRDGKARNGGGVYAGGVFNRGALIMRDCDITRNEAVSTAGESCGGGIYVSFGMTIVASTRIYENISRTHSGGFFIFNGTGRITNSSIYGNTVREGAANEGTFCGPSLSIVQSFITNISSSTIAEKYARPAVYRKSVEKSGTTSSPAAINPGTDLMRRNPMPRALLQLAAIQP